MNDLSQRVVFVFVQWNKILCNEHVKLKSNFESQLMSISGLKDSRKQKVIQCCYKKQTFFSGLKVGMKQKVIHVAMNSKYGRHNIKTFCFHPENWRLPNHVQNKTNNAWTNLLLIILWPEKQDLSYKFNFDTSHKKQRSPIHIIRYQTKTENLLLHHSHRLWNQQNESAVCAVFPLPRWMDENSGCLHCHQWLQNNGESTEHGEHKVE